MKFFDISITQGLCRVGEHLKFNEEICKKIELNPLKATLTLEFNEKGDYIISHINGKKIENDEQPEEELFTAYFDGSAKPNPGARHIGYVIYDSDGNITTEFHQSIGYGTNNQAEYQALLFLLNHVRNMKIKDIHVMGDSKLVINQINGIWKCKDPELNKIKEICDKYLKEIPKWKLEWVSRNQNKKADILSKG